MNKKDKERINNLKKIAKMQNYVKSMEELGAH
jgi:hypothetical protein